MDRTEHFLRLFTQEQNLQPFIRSVVRGSHAADDVFQDTALVLWRKFDR